MGTQLPDGSSMTYPWSPWLLKVDSQSFGVTPVRARCDGPYSAMIRMPGFSSMTRAIPSRTSSSAPFNVYLRDIDSLPRRQLIVKLNHLDFNRGFDTGQGVKRIMTGDGADIERFCRVLPAGRCTPCRNAVVEAIKSQRATQKLIGRRCRLKRKYVAALTDTSCRREVWRPRWAPTSRKTMPGSSTRSSSRRKPGSNSPPSMRPVSTAWSLREQ